MSHTQAKVISALLLVVLVLVGCGGPPAVKPMLPDGLEVDVARAAALANQADFLGAAALYESIANRSPAELQGRYLVQAAENYYRGGDRDGARAALAAAAGVPLRAEDALLRRLIEAELLIDENRASEALALLIDPPPPDAPRDLALRYRRNAALAFRLMGNLLESARELQAIDGLLTDPQARFENQLEIVRTLAVLSEQALTRLQPSPPGIEGGWMELAIVYKQATRDPAGAEPALQRWRQAFPAHPALPGLLDGLLERQQALLQRARQIALLLPERGGFDKAAAAIRDGFVAAWFQTPDAQRPELRFYDSADAATLWPTYSQAVADGADIVVGPLDKDAVVQLARAGELPVPVLALNQVAADVVPPDNLFQFALSPEDEARQVAERAWLEGLRRPVILAPAGEWAERIVSAMTARWTALGGTVGGLATYDVEAADHSAELQSLLRLDASIARHRDLQRLLGQRLAFEPRRRSDVDFVFLVSKPRQARLLRPQLQFHHAADLPVYATSHVWNGTLSAQEAPDLSGILVPDMPWLLTDDAEDPLSRQRLATLLPAAGGLYGRLYAMGIDAYRLLPHLARLRSSPLESLDGHTGHLHLDGVNQVHRQLVWAVLEQEPKVLGYSPRLDTGASAMGGALLGEPAAGSLATEPIPVRGEAAAPAP